MMFFTLKSYAKKKKSFILLLLTTFMVSFLLLQHYPPRSIVTKHISKHVLEEEMQVKSAFSTYQYGPKSNKEYYDFVAFKKKPGWHFVDFPCLYHCNKHNASVRVRFTNATVDVAGADVVLFSTGPMTIEEWTALHHYRSRHQLWVFATQEPASIVPDFLPPKIYWHSSYNLSFTFHSASDIHGAYGWYTPFGKTSTKRKPSTKWYSSKSKMAAWVSSRHCSGLGWNRTQFVVDLSKLIDLDMYGLCGNKFLRKNTEIATDVFKKYKFHLSLENSCCSEYLSEKVWNALQRWESVPIVLGGTKEEYRKLMPPHSYIHVDDFNSIEDLANYIKHVSKNSALYNEFFKWRALGTVTQQSFPYRFPVFEAGACKIVEKIKKMQNSPKLYSFDPYGPKWFGSCYRCGDHSWIQDYNIWSKRTIFSHVWEDNRTLYWQDAH